MFSTHNPRAILVRPLWNPQRVRRFAESLVGRGSHLGTPHRGRDVRKAVTTVLRAGAESASRILRRVPRAMFWKGNGWLWDSSHGGLTLHYAIPSHVIAEVEKHGFRFLQVLGDDYPRPSRPYITDWYYYVFAKSADGDSTILRIVMHREIPDDPTLRRQWNELLGQMEQPQVFYTYEWALAVDRAYHESLMSASHPGLRWRGIGGLSCARYGPYPTDCLLPHRHDRGLLRLRVARRSARPSTRCCDR